MPQSARVKLDVGVLAISNGVPNVVKDQLLKLKIQPTIDLVIDLT